MEKAVYGAGCFWCIEAVFQELKGVEKVTSGYAGGKEAEANYDDVSYKNTGHAEVVEIEFNPDEISYKDLLEVFWYLHNPTTINRQGADTGEQYRSVIFYTDDSQKTIAEESKKRTEESGLYSDPIVTSIEKLDKFYSAEDYHQNYFKNNPEQAYCQINIKPKIEKVHKLFKHLLRDDL